eukprot:853665-Prymnesium_polylepis.1
MRIARAREKLPKPIDNGCLGFREPCWVEQSWRIEARAADHLVHQARRCTVHLALTAAAPLEQGLPTRL